MVSRSRENLVITRTELWKLKDICSLALASINALKERGVSSFQEHEKFIAEILDKIKEIQEKRVDPE